MPAWYPRGVPHHPETRLRLECKSEGGRHGRIMVSAYDGERLVHFQVYFHWHWGRALSRWPRRRRPSPRVTQNWSR